MKAPSSISLLVVALILFFVGGSLVPAYYPAKKTILNADGSVLHGPDGSVVLQQDWTRYNQMMLPSRIVFVFDGIIVFWLLVRLAKYAFGWLRLGENQSGR